MKEVIEDIREEMLLEAVDYAVKRAEINDVYFEYNKFFGNTIVVSFDGENIDNTFNVTFDDGVSVSYKLYNDVKEIAFEFVNEYNNELSDQESNEQYEDNMKSLNSQYLSDKI